MVTVKTGPLARVWLNPDHFESVKPGVYITTQSELTDLDMPDHDSDIRENGSAYDLTVVVGTVFGSIYVT
jgi:hypothetical protein